MFGKGRKNAQKKSKGNRKTKQARKSKKARVGGSGLVGSLAKGFFAASWRKFCRNFAEFAQKNTFHCVRKGHRNSVESCGNVAEICRNFSEMYPFPNDPILSELLTKGSRCKREGAQRTYCYPRAVGLVGPQRFG